MNSFIKSEAGTDNNGIQQLAIQDTLINSLANEHESAGKKRNREQEEENDDPDEDLRVGINDLEDHFLEINNNNINNNNNNNSMDNGIVNNEEVVDEQDDDLLLIMNEPENNFTEENFTNVNKNIENNEEVIDTENNLQRVDDDFGNQLLERNNIINVDNGNANDEENQTQEHVGEILVYKFCDIEMRVVAKEYESQLVLTDQEQFDKKKLEEREFIEGKVPVKCQNLEYKKRSAEVETGKTFIQGWLCTKSGAVYFIGSLGQLLKCSRKQFMKLGGQQGNGNTGLGIRTNFPGMQSYTLAEHLKMNLLEIPNLWPSKNPTRKKQKFEQNFKNKAQIEQGSSSKQSQKQTNKNSEIIDKIKCEIKQILQNENNECQKNRQYMAEKLLEKFQDLEVVKNVVWCEEHKIFLWFKNQGEVFYCPECKYHENELREQVLEKQQQNSKFSEQVKKFETQEQNNAQIVEKFQENIQTEQKKLQKIVDDYEKKIRSIQSQKEQAQKQVQNAIQQKQKSKEEEKQSKKSIKELWGQISQCQSRSTRSFDY